MGREEGMPQYCFLAILFYTLHSRVNNVAAVRQASVHHFALIFQLASGARRYGDVAGGGVALV